MDGAPGVCRDCLAEVGAHDERCTRCFSTRWLRHPELLTLTLAHVDCDAFYAAVEKRDDPSLATKPVIVGGAKRGVATTACYIARSYGVRSAMPMFKALQLCPEAVVIRPDMAKYAAVSAEIQAIFLGLTPVVEPISLDEAYLDLAGTEALHAGAPARTLAGLALRIEREVGVTVSIGLSFNKLLAKLASDMDKPRGFAVIGRAEARGVLAGRPVTVLPGVGPKLALRLGAAGFTRVGDLQAAGEDTLARLYASHGRELWRFARGEDERRVTPERETKSISAETTFDRDLARQDELEAVLWSLCERVSRRLKRAELAGLTVVLKLKTATFRGLTRQCRLAGPTQLAETIYRAARSLLAPECDGRRFRLIGVGVSALDLAGAAEGPDLADPDAGRRAAVERAIDRVRERFGPEALKKGRGLGRGRGSAGRRRGIS